MDAVVGGRIGGIKFVDWVGEYGFVVVVGCVFGRLWII